MFGTNDAGLFGDGALATSGAKIYAGSGQAMTLPHQSLATGEWIANFSAMAVLLDIDACILQFI